MEQLDYLWDYQKLDLKTIEIENKKKSSSTRKELYRAVQYFKNQQQNLKKIGNDVDKKNHIYNRIYHEFDSIKKGLVDEKNILTSGDIKSPKQLDQIENRILLTQEKLDEKEAELTKLLGELESLNKKLRAINSRLRKGKSEYDKSKKEYDIESKALETKSAGIRSQMDSLKEKIGAHLLKRYETIKTNHTIVMAEVDGNRCGGCNMILASLVVQNVKNKKNVVDCENCGRILFPSSVIYDE